MRGYKIKVEVNSKKTVDVIGIKISAETNDCFSAFFIDSDGDIVAEYDGYVPEFFPGKHCGDYIMLDIDLETGRILNWKKPTSGDISVLIDGDED